MDKLALLVGKLTLALGGLIGKGSGLPGSLALKLSPNLLSHMTLPKKVIMVTGTNGKTSVTKYLVDFFRGDGKDVVTNDNGANVLIGIASTIIKNADFSLNVAGDVLILEVDEGNLATIGKIVHPNTVVITNLFQDQVDRFGSAEILAARLAKSIPEGTRVYINGDDPMASYVGSLIKNDCIYFGVDEADAGGAVAVNCPKCGIELNYDRNVYDHLGDFNCECGYGHPEIKYLAREISGKKFTLGCDCFEAPEDAIYMIYNSAAALSVALEEGLDAEMLKEKISNAKVGQGRLEKFMLNGGEAFVNLVKNPSGANLSIDLIAREEEAFNLLFAVNNREADGVDTGWLESVLFENLGNTKLKTIYLCGEARDASEEAVKEKLPQVNIIKCGADEATEAMVKSGLRGYFLGNYTALASVKKALKTRGLL